MSALALIPALPLAGFLVNGILGARLPRWLVVLVACALPAIAFALTVGLWLDLVGGRSVPSVTLFTWVALPGFRLDATLAFDAVTAVMALVITGIGTLIHVYSIGYMHDDRGFARYFAYLNLFLFFMLVLVLGANLVVTFVGWEGVGLASYLLIGFWFTDPAKTAAGVKAFVVNRVGDTGFLLAAFLLQRYVGTLDYAAINAAFATAPPPAAIGTAIGVLLLIGACGKSAQIPLHVWLPDAMAGPTPVSALIHAATMVTAGVYLLSRLSGLYLATPDAMLAVAWVGALTALAGATMGVTQDNLKKVLAYSTMSQIGLMVMACGVGAFSAGMFHLYTHAFFKACLFLAAGSVLHALGGEEDMRRMGALARRLPFTCGVFLLATLALCGLPPFAGFFSKDEILWSAFAAERGSPALWAVGTAASFLTAFYMLRAVFLTFFGASRVAPERTLHVHEPPLSMAGVLVALAAGSVAAGWIGLPEPLRHVLGVGAPFFAFVGAVLPETALRGGLAHGTESTLMLVAVAVALAGIAFAWMRYGRGARDKAAGATARDPFYRVVSHGYYVDALYERWVVRPLGWLADTALAQRAEPSIARASLERPARAGAALARGFARLQTGDLQAYLVYALIGVALVLVLGAARG